jgi:hypothetical protein
MSLMLAEIAEQPAALQRTIAEERAKIAKLGSVLKARDIDLIVLVALITPRSLAVTCSRSLPGFQSLYQLLQFTRSTTPNSGWTMR